MGKKYNIGSKSDMRRFERDLNKQVKSMAADAIQSQSYNVTCPHCSSSFRAHAGKNVCPACRNTVDLSLNINF